MIVKVDNTYNKKVIEYLRKEPDFNLFIIGDIQRYGYNNYFLNVWANINSNGKVDGVLLKYFEFLIYYSDNLQCTSEFYNLINTLDYTEISGKSECVDDIAKKLQLKKRRIVKFSRLENENNLIESGRNIKVKKVKIWNVRKVVKLYELIDEFENTTVDSIKNGLKTGRGYCIEMNRKVVAMAKSTCENNTHAMLVGVGTHPHYRNKGLATRCIVKICKELISENKIPCLFYDNEEAGKIYRKLGFKDIGTWSIYYK